MMNAMPFVFVEKKRISDVSQERTIASFGFAEFGTANIIIQATNVVKFTLFETHKF